MTTVRGILVKQFGGPEVLEYVTSIVQPSKPAARQLLVRVKSAGVNPVDTRIRTGSHLIKPSLPYTPGNDGAGVVESIGEHITDFKVGDRVYWCRCIDGSYKELTLTDEMCTFPLHDALSFQQGAAIGIPYLTAYRALVTKAQLKAGETVLVHGASGATEGVDVIMEMRADINFEKDLELTKRHGRIVVIGCVGKSEISPRTAMLKEITIYGVFLFHASPEQYSEMGAFMSQGQADGWLRPVIGQQYALEHAADAHMEVTEHKTTSSGKIVLNVAT